MIEIGYVKIDAEMRNAVMRIAQIVLTRVPKDANTNILGSTSIFMVCYKHDCI